MIAGVSQNRDYFCGFAVGLVTCLALVAMHHIMLAPSISPATQAQHMQYVSGKLDDLSLQLEEVRVTCPLNE
jgi:hypothetical protein